jgi:hypothetical protein
MSRDIAYELLVADADRRYRRWYIALQTWTLMLIPAAWLLPTSLFVLAVWLPGVWTLQKQWRKAAAYSSKLRTDKFEQLVEECRALSERTRW